MFDQNGALGIPKHIICHETSYCNPNKIKIFSTMKIN